MADPDHGTVLSSTNEGDTDDVVIDLRDEPLEERSQAWVLPSHEAEVQRTPVMDRGLPRAALLAVAIGFVVALPFALLDVSASLGVLVLAFGLVMGAVGVAVDRARRPG